MEELKPDSKKLQLQIKIVIICIEKIYLINEEVKVFVCLLITK